MSAFIRDGIVPEPGEPTVPSFLIPPTLVELDRANPHEGTVLSDAIQRARRERRHPGDARGNFQNKV